MKPTKIIIADLEDLAILEAQTRDYLSRRRLEEVNLKRFVEDVALSAQINQVKLRDEVHPVVLLNHKTSGENMIDGLAIYSKLKTKQQENVTIVSRELEDSESTPRIYKKSDVQPGLVLPTETIDKIFDPYFKPKPEYSTSSNSKHLVYAEDREGIRQVYTQAIKNYIEKHGLDIGLTVVEDGNEALEVIDALLREGVTPALITDNNMPILNGTDVYLQRFEQLRGRTAIVTALPDDVKKTLIGYDLPIIVEKGPDVEIGKIIEALLR